MSQNFVSGDGSFQIRLGRIMVKIVSGDIAGETTEAIVNSTGDEMDLTGLVSKALVARGGKKIVEACRQRGKIGGNGVFMANASGSNLKCKFVIHVNIELNAGQLVQDSLVAADGMKVNSIAIPAIGTGKHKANPDIIIPNILNGTLDFINAVKCPYIRLIKFVVFQKNMVDIFVRQALQILGRPGVRGIELPLGMAVNHQAPADAAASSGSSAAAHTLTDRFEVAASTLTSESVDEYVLLGTDRGVQVSVEVATGYITLSSTDATAIGDVRRHIENASQERQQEQQLHRSVRWQFRDDQGKWVNYSLPLNRRLETTYRIPNATVTTVTYRSGTYTFVVDLTRLQDYNENDPQMVAAVQRTD